MNVFSYFLRMLATDNKGRVLAVTRCRFCGADIGNVTRYDSCKRCREWKAEEKLMARASQKRHRKRWRNLYIVMCGGYAHTR